MLTDEERALERGQAGEDAVNRMLMNLPEDDYTVLHNILLPVGRGYTQIDHIVFSRRGVWVLETKTMSGSIYCRASDRNWTQVMRGGYKSGFQNPIRQNHKHVMAVRKISRLSPDMIFNIVVFAGEAVFRTPRPEGVIDVDELFEVICARQDAVFSLEQVKRAIAAVYRANSQNNETAVERHLTGVRKRQEWRERRREQQQPRGHRRGQKRERVYGWRRGRRRGRENAKGFQAFVILVLIVLWLISR